MKNEEYKVDKTPKLLNSHILIVVTKHLEWNWFIVIHSLVKKIRNKQVNKEMYICMCVCVFTHL